MGDNVAYKGVTLALGLVTIIGDLHKPFYVNKDEDFRVVCPECDDPTKLNQTYACPESHGNFSLSQADRAKENPDGTMTKVTAEEVKEAKASKLPKTRLDLNVHPSEEVAPRMVNGELNYIYISDNPGYGVIRNLVQSHSELTFMGVVNLRNNDKLMRLSLGLNGQLMFQEMVWPADVKELAVPQFDLDSKFTEQAELLASSMVEEFQPENYNRAARERVAEMLAQAGTGTLTSVPKSNSVMDLETMLSNALAKAPKKKAPAKRVKKAS